MSRLITQYVCQQCGFRSAQYLGKCPECESWNSFVENIEKGKGERVLAGRQGEKAEVIDLSKIQQTDYERLDTGLEEFNRVLGGGIVTGSLVLVSGDPGIGKSTLLTQLALNINQKLDVGSEKIDKEVGSSKLEDQTSNIQPQNPVSNFKHQTSNVLYVAGEESAQQIKIRVDRIKPSANLAVLNE